MSNRSRYAKFQENVFSNNEIKSIFCPPLFCKRPKHIDRFAHVGIYLRICKFAYVRKLLHVNAFTHVSKLYSISNYFTFALARLAYTRGRKPTSQPRANNG